MIETYSAWYDTHRDALLDDFFTYLRFPSISTDPAHKNDVLACKDWVAEAMRKMGLEVSVWETSGHPTVFGEYKGDKDAPTLLFYGHYDVQPEVPLDEWKSAPFEPEVRGGKVFARGAIDNKGQSFYTLLGVRTFLEQVQSPKINIKVLIEGEEEVGSPGLEEVAEGKKEALCADHVFIVDLDMYDQKVPAVTLGIRGVVNINVALRNSFADLHSGVFGGVVANPARALSQALAKMWDEEGKVTIPGFYEGMHTFSTKELSVFDWEKDPKGEGGNLGIRAFQGEGDFSLLESNWIRPTLEINGMESGYTGAGFKTIIPASSSVKLSCRLVQGQNPKKILEGIEVFLKNNLPAGMEISLEKGHGSPGVMTPPDSKTALEAAKAYEAVYKTSCRRQLCGATIPIVPLLSKICGGGLVLMGVGLPGDQMHAPNECIGLDRLKEGFLSIAKLLTQFESGE